MHHIDLDHWWNLVDASAAFSGLSVRSRLGLSLGVTSCRVDAQTYRVLTTESFVVWPCIGLELDMSVHTYMLSVFQALPCSNSYLSSQRQRLVFLLEEKSTYLIVI